MIIQCTSCQARFRFDESKLDGQSSKKVRCSKCGATFAVFAPQPAPTPIIPDESEVAPPPAFASQTSDPFAALSAAPPPPAERKKAVLNPVADEEKAAKPSDSFIIPVAEYNAAMTSSASIGVFSNNASSRSEISLTPLRAEELSSINIELPGQLGQRESAQDQTDFLAQHFMTNNQGALSDPSASTTIKLAAVNDYEIPAANSDSFQMRNSINKEYYQNEERNLKLSPLVKALREVEFDTTDPSLVLQIASAANIPTVRTSGKGGRVAVAYQIQPFTGQRSQAAAANNADLPKALIVMVKGAFILAFLAVLLVGSLIAMGGERFNPARISLNSFGSGDPIQAPSPTKSAAQKP